MDYAEISRRKSLGLALWSLWGSKHDELTVEREKLAHHAPETAAVTPNEGKDARPFSDIEGQDPPGGVNRSRSRRRTVIDENQTGSILVDENTPVSELLAIRRRNEASNSDHLSPNYVPDTGAAGKRPFLDGIAMPFTLKKEADTASMMTLNSGMSPTPSLRPLSPTSGRETPPTLQSEDVGVAGKHATLDGKAAVPFSIKKEAETASMLTLNSGMSRVPTSRPITPAKPTSLDGDGRMENGAASM